MGEQDDLTLVYMWAFKQGEEKSKKRVAELEAALRVAAGYISTKEGHTDQHPQDVYDWIVSAALGEKKDD